VTVLDRPFYDRPTLTVAHDLIGKVLVHRCPGGLTAGAIVEVEAYIGEDDPACHAAPGPTTRNAPLYGPPGFAYVYLNYGIHNLFNVVTESVGRPAAVLVRALVPLDGAGLMRLRRAGDRRPGAWIPDHELCRGPGSLARAMAITLADNRADLCAPETPSGGISETAIERSRSLKFLPRESGMFIEDRGIAYAEVAWSERVGIRVGTERMWRCFVPGCPAVSAARRKPQVGP
jgi:DNA-3-methyladenine glycosylase